MTRCTQQWRVTSERTINYDIIACDNLFDPNNEHLLFPGEQESSRRLVIVDSNVYEHHSLSIKRYFEHNNIDVKIVQFISGEENKSIESYQAILSELDDFEIERRASPIIAIGGGVLTDVVAFVASTYRRGVPHIKVPTTLMGYVDAAIGIKTGINVSRNKNRAGTFYPPLKVLLDKSFLSTLPKRHILNGVGEIIKIAIVKDATLFELLETSVAGAVDAKFQDDTSERILNRSIDGILEELEPNLFEDNLTRVVDFGHTFAYKLEMHEETDLLHGEAVVIDMVLSSILAFRRHLLSPDELDRILTLIVGLDFVIFHECMSTDFLWEAIIERTQHRDGQQRIPLPKGIGACVFANDIQRDELEQAMTELKTWAKEKGCNDNVAAG